MKKLKPETKSETKVDVVREIINAVDDWFAVSSVYLIHMGSGSGPDEALLGDAAADPFASWRKKLFPDGSPDDAPLLERQTGFAVGFIAGLRAAGLDRGQIFKRARGIARNAW